MAKKSAKPVVEEFKSSEEYRRAIILVRLWLQDLMAGKPMNIIIGTDHDGYLCGLFLTQFGATVRGYYNNRQLILHKGFKANDCVFIDADIARAAVISLGHHITNHSTRNDSCGLYNPLGIQVNNIFSTYLRGADDKHSFDYKYPNSSIMFLLWLFNYDLMQMNEWQRFLILMTDGADNSQLHYPDSATTWEDRIFSCYVEPFDSVTIHRQKKYNIRYRDMRWDTIKCKGKRGQGKGIEKASKLELQADGTYVLPQQRYIERLGEELGWPFRADRWPGSKDVNLFVFKDTKLSKVPKQSYRAVEEYNKLISSPDDLLSLIIYDKSLTMYTTKGDKDVIEEAFGTEPNEYLNRKPEVKKEI